MATCKDCTRVALQNFRGVLHESISSMVASSTTCPLCKYLLEIMGEDDVRLFNEVARNSKYLRVSMMDHPDGRESRLPFGVGRIELDVSWNGGVKTYGFSFCTNLGRMSSRAIWENSTPLVLTDRINVIQYWLQECRASHPGCQTPRTSKAKPAARFIEIPESSIQPANPRLVETSQIKEHSFSYMTLSHCWGGIDIPHKTTLANIAEYMQAIPYGMLPNTFREAITVTQKLGVRYLWIDCLCIVQDDTRDWEVEAAKMASIFQNSLLNITAASARTCYDGLGISRLVQPSCRFEVQERCDEKGSLKKRWRELFFRNRASKSPSGVAIIEPRIFEVSMRPYQEWSSAQNLFRESPLHQRGWIFQEMVLSQRIIHFLNGQFLWQCHTIMEAEDSTNFERGKSMDYDSSTNLGPLEDFLPVQGDDAARLWWSLVHEYNKRSLTYAADIMAAFSGITTCFQAVFIDKPVIGLWRKDLLKHLGWAASYKPEYSAIQDDQQRKDRLKHLSRTSPSKEEQVDVRDKRIPSWSWMSLHHSMCWVINEFWTAPTSGAPPPSPVWSAEICDVDIRWSGEPLTSAILRGVITIRTKTATLPRPTTSDMRLSISNDIKEFLLDPTLAGLDGEQIDIIALWARQYSHSLFEIMCLIVVPTGVREREYRRIGRAKRIFHVEGKSDKEHVRPASDHFGKDEIIYLV